MSDDSEDQRVSVRSRKRRRELDYESDSSDYHRMNRNSARLQRRQHCQTSRVTNGVRKSLRPRANLNYRDITSPKIPGERRYENEDEDEDEDEGEGPAYEVVRPMRSRAPPSRYSRENYEDAGARQQPQQQNNTSGGYKTRSRSTPTKTEENNDEPVQVQANPDTSGDALKVPAGQQFGNRRSAKTRYMNGTSTPEPKKQPEEEGEDEDGDEEGEEEEMEDDEGRQSSSDDVRGGRIYELRQRKPARYRTRRDFKYDIWSNAETEPKRRRRCLRAVRKRIRVDSDDDDDDEDMGPTAPFIRPPVACSSPAKHKDKLKPANDLDTSHIKLSDIQPLSIGDDGHRFDQVGGLESHVRCLQEMVILPMLYPEVFSQFGTRPPKGVLFHGPPGTGKTLLARALAGECSASTGQKVSFFLRKGADCLSKWFGESEKHLRLLFEQAQLMRPSIIFFDEIDGFCPARSAKQDQVHSSIVSTLLALMDGLEARGDVIVIGATNRIESLDPALRRPGRFDRELFFPLPARKQREAILKIHVSKWNDGAPSADLISQMADLSDGYCGADLEALCSEAMLQSLRRTYPQIYQSKFKLAIDTTKVKVERADFLRAQAQMVPAGSRRGNRCGRRLPRFLSPLLQSAFGDAVERIGRVFPHLDADASKQIQSVRPDHGLFHSRLLIVGKSGGCGQIYLAPALLQHMEHLAVYGLDISSLHGTDETAFSQEQIVTRIIEESMRRAPSVLYMPSICSLWEHASDATRAIIVDRLQAITTCAPVLVLATADMMYEDLDERLQYLFPHHLKCVLPMTNHPLKQSREDFFRPLFSTLALKPPPMKQRVKKLEVLPRAPTPPPRVYTPEELAKLEAQEESKLVELRVFLRDICHHLSKQRTFRMFAKPVDMEEVKDYLDVIKQPMDLETMLSKIDLHRYTTAKEFLQDIDLICANALEYNPDKTLADRRIRHCAVALKDYAYAKIKGEMDTDFEDECQTIQKRRQNRNLLQEAGAREAEAKPVKTDMAPKAASTPTTSKQSGNTSNGGNNISTDISEDFLDVSDLLAEGPGLRSSDASGKVNIDRNQLEKLFTRCLSVTKHSDVQALAEVYSQILKTIMRYSKLTDRQNLITDLSAELDTIEKHLEKHLAS